MSISDGESRVEGEVLVLEGDIDLLLGKDILAKFGTRMKIGALPEIFIGEMPVGVTTERVEEEETKLVMQRGVWIPARTMKIVAIRPLELAGPEEYALVEPSGALMASKKISTGKALIPGMGTLREIAITNLSNQKQWVEADTVLGKVEYVERIVEEADAVFVAAESKREEGNGEGLDFDSRIFKGLSPRQRKEILQALLEYDDRFARPGDKLGTCTAAEHSIDTGNAKPIRQAPRAKAWRERVIVAGQCKELLDAEVIEVSNSPWGAPVLLVLKKDGTWRFCVDYRRLNEVTVGDVYPLPRIEETVARLEGAAFFSIMDLQSGYWQVPIKESDRAKTAFVTVDGLYHFKVMPMGLCSAPATFQRMMDVVLSGLKWTTCLVYLDDIIVYSRTFDEHVKGLRLVLDRLRGANLKVKLEKCEFAQPQLKALGHIIDKQGISPDPEKVKAAWEFPRPPMEGSNAKRLKALRAFLGYLSYYRRFINGFAVLAKPLHDLVGTKGAFVWGEEAERSFKALKQALVKATRLAYPDNTRPFEIHPDACDYGIGAALKEERG
jgi:hypothetical protein